MPSQWVPGPTAWPSTAVTLARAGLRVRVYERADQPGGGSATRELTLPGFRHDVCSAVHPMAFESRFFREFGLQHRVEFITPEISFGQPLDGGRAGIAYRDLARTADQLGADGPAYRRLMRPLVRKASGVADFTGSTLLRLPPDPLLAIAFGVRSLEQGSLAWNARFREDVAPAMLTGVAAHTILPQPSIAAAGAGLLLGAYAHARGWPIPVGGSQSIIDAMIDDLRAHGGEVITDHEVTSLEELPRASVTLLDVTPRAFVRMAGSSMPRRYRRAMERFRYGGAVAKVDFALATRCRGRMQSFAGQAPCTSAALGRRSPPRRTKSTEGASPSAPMCSWHSSRSSTPAAHPRAVTRFGRTRTFPPGRLPIAGRR